MKKRSFKQGLCFGLVMSIAFMLRDLLTKNHYTIKGIIISITVALISGIISGLLFGWLLDKFSKSKFLAQTTKIDLEDGESILFQTGANHFKGMEGVGGRLYLTNKRLVFKSHKLNIQNHQLSINLIDVTGLKRYKTLGIINNGLSVQTSQNTAEKFVVEQADEWINQLTQ